MALACWLIDIIARIGPQSAAGSMAQGGGQFSIADPFICIGNSLIDEGVIQRMHTQRPPYCKF